MASQKETGWERERDDNFGPQLAPCAAAAGHALGHAAAHAAMPPNHLNFASKIIKN